MLFVTGGNVADFTPISLGTANTIVCRGLAANKKNWNVNIIAVPTFDTLPDDIKNTTTKQYGEDETRGAVGITHDGKVYVIADMNGNELDWIILHEIERRLGIHHLYVSANFWE